MHTTPDLNKIKDLHKTGFLFALFAMKAAYTSTVNVANIETFINANKDQIRGYYVEVLK